MSDFKFQNTLPNPNYGMSDSGTSDIIQITPDEFGQPYASYKLNLKQPTKEDRTITGKQIHRLNTYGTWNITINYNPMTKEDFEPVHRFLMQRRGSLNPFKVELPTHEGPKDPAFNTATNLESVKVREFPYVAGENAMVVEFGTQWTSGNYDSGLPSPGDLFTVRDVYDALHTKVYMVTRVETSLDYQEGNQPPDATVRLHFSPGLQKPVGEAMFLNFISPRFQVVQVGDTMSYSLNTEDLYSFSIRLEEAFY